MNRELKFRAWNGEKMRYQTQALRKMSRFFHLLDIDVKEYILMQYTGLKDKNGKEIYEGDIVNILSLGIMKEVFYNKCAFGVLVTNEIFSPIYLHEDCEVLGNIYDNPELIK